MKRQIDNLKPALEKLGEAISIGQGIEVAIDNYEAVISDFPAIFSWKIEHFIRDHANLYLKPNQRRGWQIFYANTKPNDPASLLLRYPRLAVVYLCHNDGFLREEALRLIRYNRVCPFVLAILSARLNDWVPSVRVEALASFIEILNFIDDRTLQALLPFVLVRSTGWKRWETIKPKFENELIQGEFVKRVVKAIIEAKTGQMARCLSILQQYPVYQTFLYDIMKHAKQPAVRALAARSLLNGYYETYVGRKWRWVDKSMGIKQYYNSFDAHDLEIDYNIKEVLEFAVQDESPFVRRHVADFLIANIAKISEYEIAFGFLENDKHPFVQPRIMYIKRKLRIK